MENIQEKLEQLQAKLDDKIDLAVRKGLGEEFEKNLKGEIGALSKQWDSKYKEMESFNQDLQKRYDELEMSRKRDMDNAPTPSFAKALRKELADNSQFKRFLNGEQGKATLNIKAALVTSSNASGDAVPASRVGGVFFDPTRMVRVRDFLPIIGTSSNRITYVQETSYTNNAATRAEASAYGESEFKIDAVDANVRSIGSTIDLTKEMLEDIPYLTGYIATRLPAKIMNKEDDQLLNGNGSAPNVQGLITSGGGTNLDDSSTGDFWDFFATAEASAYANEFDVLVWAKNEAMKSEYAPNVVLVHPTDYHKMLLRKDANANYVVYTNGVLTLYGIPIFPNTAVTSDKFIIGDFRQGAALVVRDDMEVSFSEENEDNFKKDRITVKGSERIAFPIYRPNAFVWGDFSDGIAALK